MGRRQDIERTRAPIDEMKFQSLTAFGLPAVRRGMLAGTLADCAPAGTFLRRQLEKHLAALELRMAPCVPRAEPRCNHGRARHESATGLDVFDKTLQITNIWLDEIMGQAWARPTGGMNTRGEMPCKSVKR